MKLSKVLILIILIVFSGSVFAQSYSGSIDLSTPGELKKVEKKKELIKKKKQKLTTASSGMLPVFEESPIVVDESVNEVLEILGQPTLPVTEHTYPVESTGDLTDIIPVGNTTFDLDQISDKPEKPQEKTEFEKYMDDYVDTFSQVTLIEQQLQNNVSEADEETEKNYLHIRDELDQKTDHLTQQVVENENVMGQIATYLVKNVTVGNVAALERIVDRIIENLENLDVGQFTENKNKVIDFFKKVKVVINKFHAFIQNNENFRKFYILFLILNNMVANNNYEPLVPGADPGTIDQAANQTGTDDDSDVVSDSNSADDDADGVSDDQPVDNTTQPTPTPPANGNADGQPVSGTLDNKIVLDRLMENAEFTDNNTMTAGDIQAFLERKNSCLKNIYRGQYPSAIIKRVSDQYGINPKVMLDMFQKEQSLISRKTASQHKLDWALGVGCYDNGSKNENFRGFERQIASAARILNHWYNDGIGHNVSQNGYNMRINYGTRNINLKNECTYSLYKYTPHSVDIHLNVTGGGNYLFAQVYISYWGGFLR